VILVNAPANRVPQSGAGANTIKRSGIANFREYSGPQTQIPSSGRNQSTGKKGLRREHSSSSRHAATKSDSHARTIVGKPVPAGPAARRRIRSRG
jgi:hypothetical protein